MSARSTYEQTLINIIFHFGKCWSGSRLLHDPQTVARRAIKRANPRLSKKLDRISSVDEVVVRRDGTTKLAAKPIKKRTTR